jgi:hypothetical protein
MLLLSRWRQPHAAASALQRCRSSSSDEVDGSGQQAAVPLQLQELKLSYVSAGAAIKLLRHMTSLRKLKLCLESPCREASRSQTP